MPQKWSQLSVGNKEHYDCDVGGKEETVGQNGGSISALDFEEFGKKTSKLL